MKIIQTAIVMAALLAPVFISSANASPDDTSDMRPAAIHAVPLKLDDGQIRLDDLRGQVVLLDFWASWCGPCRQSFPWMNSLQKDLGSEGFKVVAINLDENRSDAERFLQDVPAEFDIAYDPDGEMATAMDVMGMPMSYLIDREGRVRHSLIGFTESRKKVHEQHIRELLAE